MLWHRVIRLAGPLLTLPWACAALAQILPPPYYPDPHFVNNGHHFGGGGMWRPPYPPPAGVFPPVSCSTASVSSQFWQTWGLCMRKPCCTVAGATGWQSDMPGMQGGGGVHGC